MLNCPRTTCSVLSPSCRSPPPLPIRIMGLFYLGEHIMTFKNCQTFPYMNGILLVPLLNYRIGSLRMVLRDQL